MRFDFVKNLVYTDTEFSKMFLVYRLFVFLMVHYFL